MRGALRERVLTLIRRLSGGRQDPRTRDRLLWDIALFQRDRVEAYARLWASRPPAGQLAPALPSDVFRFARVATFPPRLERRVFLTSGTTSGLRGRHPFRDLSLYDQAAEAAARLALFGAEERMRLAILAPHPSEVPESSLSYMLGRFEDWFGRETAWVWGHPGGLDVELLVRTLDLAVEVGEPLGLLGTTFAFVHAEDRLGGRRWTLPEGSVVMPTGGTKGRSREVAPDALTAALGARYGIRRERVIGEYGMTELSSQLYASPLPATRGAATPPGPGRYWAPGWVRTTVVDPETLAPVPPGTVGVLRIDDAANLDSVSAIQTADLAIQHPDGLELRGRAPGAVPRGCSLAIEEALRDPG
ncbi:MAG: acyl-protein synthetase [Sandaracinaceae bacterium]